jgi:glutamate 5-kinase
MYSKLKAAREASGHGIQTWLVQGDQPSILLEVAQDRGVGTRIDPQGPKRAKRKGRSR